MSNKSMCQTVFSQTPQHFNLTPFYLILTALVYANIF